MTCCTKAQALGLIDWLAAQALQGDDLCQRLLPDQIEHWLKHLEVKV